MLSAVLASGGSLDWGAIFFDLAVVLIVAKLAAEFSERVGIPAVLGEIVAGIAVGPSMLGLVDPTDALKILAEVGVIVLLAQVGLETDLDELRRVGRASMLVAIVGVVLPMSTGYFAGGVLGESVNASLFLGASLAATSVGITARVFGDLKALTSTEARIVLGAAVADDVLGLVILTVVTRIVEKGSIDVAGLASTIGLAVGFLVVAGAVGLALLPRLFAYFGSRVSSSATMGVVAAGITFLFSAAASGAELAPIIGAFVAGTALARTSHHERIERDFQAIGAVFIPVFFVQIGVDTEVTKFFDLKVLSIAAVLTVIAIAGKALAAVGAAGTPTDKVVIGAGMVPRGEVGLIFATIGVNVGVFDDELYAVVLLVVLVTTVITPPVLRWRINSKLASATVQGPVDVDEPTGGWVVASRDAVSLQGNPPSHLALKIALDAALRSAQGRPDDSLQNWLHQHRETVLSWDEETTSLLGEILMRGNARSWRLLEVSGVIDRAMPEIARAIAARRSDATELDPTHHASMPVVEALRGRLGRVRTGESPLLWAALVADFSEDFPATDVLDRLILDQQVRDRARVLITASNVLHRAAAAEPYGTNPRAIAQLADFLGTPEMVEYCRLLTEARGNLEEWQYPALLELTTRTQELLAHPELLDGSGDSLEAVRRREAMGTTDDPYVRDRIRTAGNTYVLSHSSETLVRHATLIEPTPAAGRARVTVTPGDNDSTWIVDVAAADAPGLLARICAALSSAGLDVVSADVATWPDGAVLDSFVVAATTAPEASLLEAALATSLAAPLRLPTGITGARLGFALDNVAHPWHSIVSVSGEDRPGLLGAMAAAFAAEGVAVHHARVSTEGVEVADRFEVATKRGKKINQRTLDKVAARLR
ncbi:MAG: High-affinity Na(+)/H(+) antiporter NhaS3 [Actinomycetota bacterium]